MQTKASLSGSTAWYTVGNFFVRSISFLLLPVYSNLIHPYDFGKYSLILSAYAIIAVLYQWGMQNSLSKFYISETDESKRKEIFTTIITFVLGFGLLFTVIIYLFSNQFSTLLLGSVDDSILIKLSSIALFFDCLNYFGLQLFRTIEKPKKVVLYSAISAVINLVLNIYLLYVEGAGIKGIILAQMISNIVLFLLLFYEFKSMVSLKIKIDLLKNILFFSFPFLIGGFFSIGVDVIDRFFLDHFLGEEKVGIYSFSYRIAMIMNLFVISLRSAWVPYSLRRYNEGNYQDDFGTSLTKIIAASLFIFISISLLVDDLFSFKIGTGFLFDQKYAGGIKVIPVILIAYLFNALISYFFLYSFVSGKSYHFLISDALAFVVNIAANLLLIPLFDIMGAAAATLLSFIISFIYFVWISHSRIKIDYEVSKIITLLLVTAAGYLISFYTDNVFVDIGIISVSVFLFYKISGLRIKMFAQQIP